MVLPLPANIANMTVPMAKKSYAAVKALVDYFGLQHKFKQAVAALGGAAQAAAKILTALQSAAVTTVRQTVEKFMAALSALAAYLVPIVVRFVCAVVAGLAGVSTLVLNSIL